MNKCKKRSDLMKYAGLIKNDINAAPGLCVSFFSQGCPHRCKNCQNPETWDFKGGKEFTQEVLTEIIEALSAQGIERKFCIMGGEPLCEENIFLTCLIIKEVRKYLPKVEIYLWTGYLYEDLLKSTNPQILNVLTEINYLIDGPYIEELRDITLEMRGSSNQRIIDLNKKI